MNRKVSEVVGEKLFDLANLAAGAILVKDSNGR